MSIKIAGAEPSDIKVGSQEVQSVYAGSTEVWSRVSPVDWSKDDSVMQYGAWVPSTASASDGSARWLDDRAWKVGLSVYGGSTGGDAQIIKFGGPPFVPAGRTLLMDVNFSTSGFLYAKYACWLVVSNSSTEISGWDKDAWPYFSYNLPSHTKLYQLLNFTETTYGGITWIEEITIPPGVSGQIGILLQAQKSRQSNTHNQVDLTINRLNITDVTRREYVRDRIKKREFINDPKIN